MNITEIQERVNALRAAMTAKGLREPCAEFNIDSDVEPFIWLKWKDAAKRDHILDTHYEKIEGFKAPRLFDEADAFIAALPSAEENRMKEFMGALGSVIDLGRSNGIDVEFINPLVTTMKRLSENIITDQRAA